MGILEVEAYPPGQLIREELEARGWSQQYLAQVMGKNHALVMGGMSIRIDNGYSPMLDPTGVSIPGGLTKGKG
jgi:hypothetical protein